MRNGLHIYRRWMRDRRLSTFWWTFGLLSIVVMTAAFYPSMAESNSDLFAAGDDDLMAVLMGLSEGVDPSSPLGFLWIGLYANIVPFTLLALGVVLGTAAIAGDEDTGALEYTLARPTTRTAVALSRFAAAVTILLVVAALTAITLIICIPIFELGDSITTTLPDGSTVTQAGATAGDFLAGTFAAFAVGLGALGVAFLLGGATGKKGFTTGVSTAFVVGGYALYTLSNTTGSLEWLTWLSSWRWYIADTMLISGLTWSVALPFITALVGLLIGWQLFLRRDLQNP
jgi:ABC-2 type transport system permease protein